MADDIETKFAQNLAAGEYWIIMQMGAMGFRYGPYTATEAGAIAKQCVAEKIPAYMSIIMGGEFDWDFARDIAATANAAWLEMADAPHDGSVIIGDVGGVETRIVWWKSHQTWRRMHEDGFTVLDPVEPTKWRAMTPEEQNHGR